MSGFAGLLTVLGIKEIVQIILKDMSLDQVFQLSACCKFLRNKWFNRDICYDWKIALRMCELVKSRFNLDIEDQNPFHSLLRVEAEARVKPEFMAHCFGGCGRYLSVYQLVSRRFSQYVCFLQTRTFLTFFSRYNKCSSCAFCGDESKADKKLVMTSCDFILG